MCFIQSQDTMFIWAFLPQWNFHTLLIDKLEVILIWLLKKSKNVKIQKYKNIKIWKCKSAYTQSFFRVKLVSFPILTDELVPNIKNIAYNKIYAQKNIQKQYNKFQISDLWFIYS